MTASQVYGLLSVHAFPPSPEPRRAPLVFLPMRTWVRCSMQVAPSLDALLRICVTASKNRVLYFTGPIHPLTGVIMLRKGPHLLDCAAVHDFNAPGVSLKAHPV